MAHEEVHHDYHLVDPSPWPIVGSIGAFTMMVGAVFWMNDSYKLNPVLVFYYIYHGRQ